MDPLASPRSESEYEKLGKELIGEYIVTLAFYFETSTGFVLGFIKILLYFYNTVLQLFFVEHCGP